MTSVQKIISGAAGKLIPVGGSATLLESEYPNISFCDRLCGAYGSLYLDSLCFVVPKGIFCDLTGALRNDVTTEGIAEYFHRFFSQEGDYGTSLEIGGDSLSYLTMDDRFAIGSKLSELGFFAVIFECDFQSVEYVYENFGYRQKGVFNDGPDSYEKIISLDISAI